MTFKESCASSEYKEIFKKKYCVQTETPDFSKGYPNNKDNIKSGLYTTTENDDYDSPSYYFRGDKEKLNNNVEFGGKKWKIVRINGDGTIRLILANNDWNIDTTSIGKKCSMIINGIHQHHNMRK